MEERDFEKRAAEAFERVLDLFDDVDPDDADIERAGDVLSIEFPARPREKIVLNTQRPARQLWLAGGKRAWHFSFDPQSGRWLDDRGEQSELLAVLVELCQAAGLSFSNSGV